MRHRPGTMAAFAVALGLSWTARAAESPGQPPVAGSPESRGSIYRVRPAVDGPILLVGALGTLVPYAFSSNLIRTRCPCAPREVNSFDRGVIGNRSDTAGWVSDVTVGLALAAPLAVEAWGVRDPLTLVEDLSVYAEVLLVNGALVTVVKHVVQRPLPRTYEGQADLVNSPRGYRSFYSGHASLAFAALSAGSMTVGLRYGHFWVPWLITGAVGTSVAAERVIGGYHFYTDVLVGAAVGTAVGIVIPLLHARGPTRRVRVTLLPAPGQVQLAAVGRF
jgi:hypothetical protein